jgi:hypothetical protein
VSFQLFWTTDVISKLCLKCLDFSSFCLIPMHEKIPPKSKTAGYIRLKIINIHWMCSRLLSSVGVVKLNADIAHSGIDKTDVKYNTTK